MSLDAPLSLDSKTKGLPPERFANPAQLREFSNKLISADEPRAKARRQVQGLIDGNRPVGRGILTAQGQGWRADVNYREAEGQVATQRTPYYDLATENDPCLEVEIDYGLGQQKEEWEREIAANLHWAFHDWPEFNWHLQLQQSEMVTHGIGSHVFLSKTDWRPSTYPMRHVLFPDRTRSCLGDTVEAFMVREPLKAHQLYRMIRNESAASKVGWKVTKVKDAIIKSQSNDNGGTRRTEEDYQRMMKNNDLGFSHNASKETWLNHIFVREFEGGRDNAGGLSHYIIEEGGNDYLFKSRNRFDEVGNVVRIFPYDIGSDGTIHSVRGLGVRIYPFIELSNRLKNQMVDSVMVGSSVLLTSRGTVDPAKLSLTSVGPMKLLPPGVEPSTWRGMELDKGPLALSQELRATSGENNKTFRQSSAQREYAQTAEEVRTVASDQSQLQKAAHNMYYGCMDGLYGEMTRRIVNPNYTTLMPGGRRAVEFQRRCRRDGIPKEALAKIISVRAVRALGAGSAMQRIVVARELMAQLFPGADEVSRYNLKRDYVAALASARHVDRYVPTMDAAMAPDNEDSLSVLENDALISGGEALVTSKQNHFKHAMRHIAKANQVLQALSQGADPARVFQIWEALGPHIAAHLAYLEQDPTRKQQFKVLEAQFNSLGKMADKLGQHLDEQAASKAEADQAAAANGGQQAVGPFGIPELDIEYAKMNGQLAIKAEKMRAEMALKAEKQKGQGALADAQTAAKIQRESVATGVTG